MNQGQCRNCKYWSIDYGIHACSLTSMPVLASIDWPETKPIDWCNEYESLNDTENNGNRKESERAYKEWISKLID